MYRHFWIPDKLRQIHFGLALKWRQSTYFYGCELTAVQSTTPRSVPFSVYLAHPQTRSDYDSAASAPPSPSENIPGPRPKRCECPHFDLEQSIEGPFSTSHASKSITQRKEQLCMASLNQAPRPNCPRALLDSFAFKSLVFTHNDLNMCNLLLDDDHVLWVDCEFAGFFPLWSCCGLSILG